MANIGAAVLPLLTGNGTSGGISGSPSLHLLTSTGTVGLSSAGVLPLLQASGTGSSPVNVGEAVLHLLTASGNALVGEIGQGEAILPLLTSSGHIYPVVIGTGGLGKLFLLRSSGWGLSGSISIDGSGGSLPLLTGSGSAGLPAIGIGAATLPLLIGNGHGIVTALTFNRKAIVMHLTNHAVSEYKNYDFNSLVQFNGYFLGINEQGVYILDGNDDLGQLIQARIKSGVEDLGKGAISVPREAWLAYRSDYGMQLDVRMNEDEDLPVTIFGKVTRGIGEWREKLGRGIKARFFTWDLKNVAGSDFSLQSLRILGDIIKRKRR